MFKSAPFILSFLCKPVSCNDRPIGAGDLCTKMTQVDRDCVPPDSIVSPTTVSDCSLSFNDSQLRISENKDAERALDTSSSVTLATPDTSHGTVTSGKETTPDAEISMPVVGRANCNSAPCAIQTDYAEKSSWFSYRLWGCLEPLWKMIGKAAIKGSEEGDGWEIPFESIRDLEWVGSGAQGAVFRGKYNNMSVAVKKVKQLEETEKIVHFRKLKHENIVSFIGVCTQSPCYCIVMEFCQKGQLYEVLRSDRQITPTLMLDWANHVAYGMSYLHQHKVIHRDLKSPNILVTEYDMLKISDFGTSRQQGDQSTKMSFAGNVGGTSPGDPCASWICTRPQ